MEGGGGGGGGEMILLHTATFLAFINKLKLDI